jgi:MYXO-CTERM domain-containing protein
MLDPASTLFVSGDTGEAIPVDLSDPGTVTWTPEPGALPLLGITRVLLRRRRREQ